jgi:hypothetical protein
MGLDHRDEVDRHFGDENLQPLSAISHTSRDPTSPRRAGSVPSCRLQRSDPGRIPRLPFAGVAPRQAIHRAVEQCERREPSSVASSSRPSRPTVWHPGDVQGVIAEAVVKHLREPKQAPADRSLGGSINLNEAVRLRGPMNITGRLLTGRGYPVGALARVQC